MAPLLALDSRSPVAREEELGVGRALSASRTVRLAAAKRLEETYTVGAESARNREMKERLYPSVVTILVRKKGSRGNDGWTEIGSGFVISEDGMIGTAAHVADFPGAEFAVRTYHRVDVPQKGTGFLMKEWIPQAVTKADVVGFHGTFDAAVLKIEPRGLNLKPISIFDSDTVEDGDVLFTMGTSFGLLDNAISQGVAAKTPKAWNSELSPEQNMTNQAIITDAGIQGGNSGGVLVDEDGDMVGITVYELVQTSPDGTPAGGSSRSGAVAINDVKLFLHHAPFYGRVQKAIAPIIESAKTNPKNYAALLKQAVGVFRREFNSLYGSKPREERQQLLQQFFNDTGILINFYLILENEIRRGNKVALVELFTLIENEFGVRIGANDDMTGRTQSTDEVAADGGKRAQRTLSEVSGLTSQSKKTADSRKKRRGKSFKRAMREHKARHHIS